MVGADSKNIKVACDPGEAEGRKWVLSLVALGQLGDLLVSVVICKVGDMVATPNGVVE